MILCQYVNKLARPVNSACFQVFSLEVSKAHNCLELTYQPDSRKPKKAYLLDAHSLRLLARTDWFRDLAVEMDCSLVAFDHTSVYFETVVWTVTAAYLNRYPGISIILLRGSEVSLDQLVQLQK